MSEQKPRLPLIALGAAVLAVAVSVIAAIVVATRDDAAPPVSATGSGSSTTVLDHEVTAADVVRIREHLDVVIDAGVPRGVRVSDAELAKALGLQSEDTLLALSGRPVLQKVDFTDMLVRAGTMRVTTLYVELERDGTRALMRWQVNGSLLDARRDAQAAAGSAALAIGPGSAVPGLKNPFSDPLLDMLARIEKIDDTHYRVPRDTAASMILEAEFYKRGARFVPSLKNGAPDGYKLFAIRSGSVFDKVGFKNADTVHSINGAPLADVDDLVSLMNDAKRKAREFRFDITRGGQPLSLHIELAP